MLSAPTEASALLGLVAICMTFLFAFYLYMSKKFCFNTIGGFSCCDETNKNFKNDHLKKEGYSYQQNVDDGDNGDDGSSSDSGDELIRRLQRSTNTFNNNHNHVNNNNKLIRQKSHECNDSIENKKKIIKSLKSRRSLEIEKSDIKSNTIPKTLIENELKTEVIKRVRGKTDLISNQRTSDLISLAEKGRIGKGGSSGGSCSSEANSVDIEEDSTQLNFYKNKNKISTTTGIGTTSTTTTGATRITSRINESEAIDEETRSHFSNSGYEKSESSDIQSTNSQEYNSSQTHSDSHEQLLNNIKYGTVDVGFAYDAPTRKLKVTVTKAQDLPCKDRGGANQIHVRIVLLPHKRQKHKTKVKQSGNPIFFNETFTFTRINPKEVMNLGLRFRLYGTLFARREHMIGQAIIAFACMKPQQQETRLCLALEQRSNHSQSDSFFIIRAILFFFYNSSNLIRDLKPHHYTSLDVIDHVGFGALYFNEFLHIMIGIAGICYVIGNSFQSTKFLDSVPIRLNPALPFAVIILAALGIFGALLCFQLCLSYNLSTTYYPLITIPLWIFSLLIVSCWTAYNFRDELPREERGSLSYFTILLIPPAFTLFSFTFNDFNLTSMVISMLPFLLAEIIFLHSVWRSMCEVFKEAKVIASLESVTSFHFFRMYLLFIKSFLMISCVVIGILFHVFNFMHDYNLSKGFGLGVLWYLFFESAILIRLFLFFHLT